MVLSKPMRAKFILTLDQAEILRYGNVPDGFEVISDEMTDHSRWHVWHTVIFKKDGKVWSWKYGSAATENQEDRGFYGEGDLTAIQVFPVARTVIVYE